MRCSTIPVLGDPPQISANGMHVLIVDANGETRLLARRPWSILIQDADRCYLADGSDEAFINLPFLKTDSGLMRGLLSRTIGGRVMLFVNETAEEMVPVLSDGKLVLKPRSESSVPVDGTGFLIRNPGEPSSFAGMYGMYWIDSSGKVTRIAPGVNGQTLAWVNDVPAFQTGGTTALSGSLGVTGIDEVKAFRQDADNTRVNITIPQFVVTNGTDDKKLLNVNVLLDINSGLIPGGSDSALADNTWYYFYIISDNAGTNVNVVASPSPTFPNLTTGGFTTPPTYTRYGLCGLGFWQTAALGLVNFRQKGRRFAALRRAISTDVTVGTAWAFLTAAKQNTLSLLRAVPPIAKTMSGTVGGSNNAAAGNVAVAVVVATSFDADGGIGEQYIGSKEVGYDLAGDNLKRDTGPFIDLLIQDPTNADQMLAWKANASNSFRKIFINGYTI